jgi:gluconolactonase
MTGVVVIEETRMIEIVSPQAALEHLSSVAVWGEGPVYCEEDDSIIWSDAHGDRLLRWSVRGDEVIRQPSHFQSGNDLDLEGRLVSCSSGDRAIIRQEHSGKWNVLVDCFQGKRLNSPNDLTVKRDGTLWFTDPPYGLTQPDQGYGGSPEQPGSFVYCFDPASGDILAAVRDMVRPNGLIFSPNEDRLYISDSAAFNMPQGPHHVRVYDVMSNDQVENGRVFAIIEPGQPDGLGMDTQGNLFVSAADGVQVYAPDGVRLGKILVPEICSNMVFGGVKGDRLFITAGHSLYAIRMKTSGIRLLRQTV